MAALALEVALYFGRWYVAFYWVLSLLVFVYKGTNLPYPDGVFGMELMYLFLLALVEPARLTLASQGNKTRVAFPLTLSLGLALPVLILHIYYLLWQTYILRIEQLLNGIALGLGTAQLLLSVLAIVSSSAAPVP
mmetsp:Transcript_19722/g.64116  ORF Transcript_19722/g.64116 Transcript_19722/m.64116 type:complete len:135 (+) Transcript_19722:102-506(+)|eukprot:CAMPEP_0170144490 /NCGR_PEP_ID=MMETSP0033_2-20121228/13951_1 /TAXON_ID=195969 /ORGANISM="Dolichomastix tenuilepis, Strain CCMP3274" /LENGTH=134 /DNA_ID=CAMNT_0010380991 /DNA_START=102 /DNA_END=506 /DNA_ORIENTATION=+